MDRYEGSNSVVDLLNGIMNSFTLNFIGLSLTQKTFFVDFCNFHFCYVNKEIADCFMTFKNECLDCSDKSFCDSYYLQFMIRLIYQLAPIQKHHIRCRKSFSRFMVCGVIVKFSLWPA